MRTGRKKNLMIKTQGFKNQIHLVKKIKGNVNLMQIHIWGNLHISHKWQFLGFFLNIEVQIKLLIKRQVNQSKFHLLSFIKTKHACVVSKLSKENQFQPSGSVKLFSFLESKYNSADISCLFHRLFYIYRDRLYALISCSQIIYKCVWGFEIISIKTHQQSDSYIDLMEY